MTGFVVGCCVRLWNGFCTVISVDFTVSEQLMGNSERAGEGRKMNVLRPEM